MTDVFIGVFLLICAVEAFLIFQEASRLKGESKVGRLLKGAQAEIEQLKGLLKASEQALDSAKKEVQGIYVLWNRSIDSEQKMRKELDIAKTQLTYLAQKVVRKEGPEVQAEPVKSAYWNLSHGQTIEEKSEYRQKQSAFETQRELL